MIIYEANETDFFSNGLGTLPDATSALVTEERNGEFVLDVIYPQHGLRSELLTKNRIIKADAGHELKDQRFVIKKVTPTMDSDGYIYLTVHAEHVSYITADLGVTPNLTLSGNATQALEQWQANLVGGHPDIVVDSDIISEYETSLDITKATNARQVLGGVEGSILDTWGGEYKFDNLHISLRGQRGTTANTLISYGRNLLTFEQEDDITDTYTSIYPYANVGLADGNNSKLITVNGYFVDSQYVDRYPNRKLLPVDFGSQFTDYKIGSKPSESDTGIYTTEAEIKKKLTELAKQYIENNRIGIPKVSTKITFADLSKTSEYAPLEQVNLCDIIPIRFEKLGIDTTIKVTRVVWNVLLDEYDSIELGDLRTTLGESISALESKTTGLANAVITAQSTADNQNSIFRTNGGTAEPVAKKTGDLWFKTDGDYQYMYQWDGAVWHEVVNTKTTDDIAKEVDKTKADAEALSSEVESAKKQAQEAFAKAGFNADEISNVKTATSEVTETLTSTVRQASELSERLKNVASETASRYSTVSSELSGARNSLNAKASELAKEVASNSANITKANSQLYSQSEGLAKVSQSATKMEQTMTDLSGRVHTVETTASETKEALADAKGNITTLTKRADGTDTKIADAQGRVQTLESRADTWDLELSKKVDNTTYNAGIQNLGNQINLKANKSDLDGYATKAQLSVESDRITQQASEISSVTTIANGANSKIDSLSFGGRNLIDRTKTLDRIENINGGLRQVAPKKGSYNGFTTVIVDAGQTNSYAEWSVVIEPEETYTFSFYAKGERVDAFFYGTGSYIGVASSDVSSGGYTYNNVDGHVNFSLTSEFKRYWVTWKLKARTSDSQPLWKNVLLRNDSGRGPSEVYGWQLEKASRPSDYSLSQNDLQRLASEDTASQINQYNTGTVQPIKGIANDALGKANSANDKIDGLRIGGRNLLKGTSDQFKTISNSGWTWAYTWTNNDNNTSKISLANFHTGDYLTYSAWVINDSDVDITPEITLYDKDFNNPTWARGNILHPGQSGLVTSTSQIGGNDWYVRPSIISTNGQAGVHQIRIKEEMLNLGNVRLPWQPSDLDLPATIVTTVTEVSNAQQIINSSGIHTDINKVRTETTGKIDTVNSRVSDVSGRVDNVNNKIDNLKVGGRNLIDRTKTLDRIENINGGLRQVAPKKGSYNGFTTVIVDAGQTNSYAEWSVVIEPEETYTFSFYAKGERVDAFFYGTGSYIGVASSDVSSGGYTYNNVDGHVNFSLTSEFKRYWVTWKLKARTSDSQPLWKNVLLRNDSGRGPSEVYGWQLEKASRPSDYSLSQNDLQRLAHDDAASQINASITPISTTVNQYTHTTDNLANKVTDIFKDIGYDQEHHKFTDKFKSVVETAGGTKETYKMLEGKIDGIVVGGKNLLDGTADFNSTYWYAANGPATLMDINGKKAVRSLANWEGRRNNQTIDLEPDTDYTISVYVRVNGKDGSGLHVGAYCNLDGTQQTLGNFNTGTLSTEWKRVSLKWHNDSYKKMTTFRIEWYGDFTTGRGSAFSAEPQLEKGNKPSDWGMSDNDINKKISDANVSIAKTNETIKTVDGTVATVKNSLDKTKSIVTQLANLFDVTVGDSSISVTNGGVLVKGKQIHIDGQTVIDNASIDGAKIKSLDAGKITTGTLNAACVKVINLDANNITTGTLTGPGMALDLNNGSFRINNSDNSLKVEMDSGELRFYRQRNQKALTGTISASDWGFLNDNDQSLNLTGQSGAILKTEDFKMTNLFVNNGFFLTTTDVPSSNGSAVILHNNDIKIIGQTNSQNIASRISILAGKPYTYKTGAMTNVEYTGIDIIGDENKSGVVDINAGSEVRISGSRNKIDLNLGGSSLVASVANSSNYDDTTRKSEINMREDAIYFNFTKDKEDLTPLALYNGGTVRVKDLSVWGSKNAIVQTTAGWTKINAYETAEYYFGDLGTAITDDTSTVRVGIEPLFSETVNTEIPYQVFVTSYGEGYAWVAERGSNYFVIKSSVPNLEIGYEIKAKRKGYENVRLEIDKHMEVNK